VMIATLSCSFMPDPHQVVCLLGAPHNVAHSTAMHNK
jgi:hypothetical protein